MINESIPKKLKETKEENKMRKNERRNYINSIDYNLKR